MKLVLVEWVDSHSGRGWRDIDRIKETDSLLHARSVGWLLRETKEVILLASHITGEDNGNILLQASGDMCIPKVAVKKITVLKEPKKK